MDTGAMPVFRTSCEADPSYSSSWDPLISFTQSSNLGAATTMASGFVNSSYSWTLENHGIESSCQKAQYPSDMGLAEMLPMLPCFGNGNLTEMIGPFGLPECGQVPNNTTKTPKNCRPSEERIVGRPAGAKRRRRDDSLSPLNEPRNDQDQKAEQEGANNQTAEQSKDASLAKENYVHVRAKRGQATNSHSLAERVKHLVVFVYFFDQRLKSFDLQVRRERISERMKVLEELVPGCNKITGKALMLDEIINYVQSLQQQVVFLSMKLATVNPDLNIDIEPILSRNGPRSRCSNGTVPGFGQGMNPFHHFPHSIPQGTFAGIIPNEAQLHSMPQVGWENEIQSVFQTGYGSNLANGDMGTHGRPRS